MGNAQVMTAKVAWDNAAYWSVTALLFFQRRLRHPEFMASIDPLMRRFFVLHARMQQLFAAWGRADASRVRAFARQHDGRRSAAAAAKRSRRPDDGRRGAARTAGAQLRLAGIDGARLAAAGGRARPCARAIHRAGPRLRPADRAPSAWTSTPLKLAHPRACLDDASRQRLRSRARITSAESLPPNASDVDTPQRTRCSRAALATTSIAQSGSVSP